LLPQAPRKTLERNFLLASCGGGKNKSSRFPIVHQSREPISPHQHI